MWRNAKRNDSTWTSMPISTTSEYIMQNYRRHYSPSIYDISCSYTTDDIEIYKYMDEPYTEFYKYTHDGRGNNYLVLNQVKGQF